MAGCWVQTGTVYMERHNQVAVILEIGFLYNQLTYVINVFCTRTVLFHIWFHHNSKHSSALVSEYVLNISECVLWSYCLFFNKWCWVPMSHYEQLELIQIRAFHDRSARIQTWNVSIPAASQERGKMVVWLKFVFREVTVFVLFLYV